MWYGVNILSLGSGKDTDFIYRCSQFFRRIHNNHGRQSPCLNRSSSSATACSEYVDWDSWAIHSLSRRSTSGTSRRCTFRCHARWGSCQYLNETSWNRWKDRGGLQFWHLRTLDLNPTDFCVWSLLKT